MAKTSAARATAQPEPLREHHIEPTRNNPVDEVREMPASLPTQPSDEDALRSLISAAAYLRAESRGFAPGCELDDWLMAEAEVLARLGLRPEKTN